MQTSEIKTKAKVFLSGNKRNPASFYPATYPALIMFMIAAVTLSIVLKSHALVIVFLCLILVVLFIFSAPVEFSAVDFYLRTYNLEFSEKSAPANGFNKENLGRTILLKLIRFGILLLTYALLIVPGILFTIISAFSYFTLRDHPQSSAWESIKRSQIIMKGHWGEYFKLMVSFLGWNLLGVITLGIAFIYVKPYFETAKSICYCNVLLGLADEEISDAVLTKKYSQTSDALINKEIADIERQIVEMERAKAAAIEAKTNIAKQNSMQAENAGRISKGYKSDEKLLMDDVGNVDGILDEDQIEEVELPTAVSTPPYPISDEFKTDEIFISREVEIMEDESFEQFKERVSMMRRERKQEMMAANQVNSYGRGVPNGANATSYGRIDPNGANATSYGKIDPKGANAMSYGKVDSAAARANDKFFNEKTSLNVETEEESNQSYSRPAAYSVPGSAPKTETVKADTAKADANKTATAKVETPQADNGAGDSVTKPKISSDELKKLSRTELIEKLRQDREKKNKK